MEAGNTRTMEPITCRRSIQEIPVAGTSVGAAVKSRIEKAAINNDMNSKRHIVVASDFWPSLEIASMLANASGELVICSPEGRTYAWVTELEFEPSKAQKLTMDEKSLIIKYPWQILAINEELVGMLDKDIIEGTVRERVSIDGHIVLGKGSVILPGVFIEGNVIIGEDCKIGPNCYIRGNSTFGKKCHIGQAVEIKNSLFMDKVSAGHLSYFGDSIVCSNTNFGAGTITSNLRHDGKNHKSTVDGELVDTGRRKFGCIVGDNVHTGIHTSIYPGRKIWPDASTRPGEIVQKDIKPS